LAEVVVDISPGTPAPAVGLDQSDARQGHVAAKERPLPLLSGRARLLRLRADPRSGV
jgi:hypothetical protein